MPQDNWDFIESSFIDTCTNRGIRYSSNGYHFPTNGEIRVLIAFIELVYADPSIDPQPNGSEGWPKGQLPIWKDDLFDPVLPNNGIAQGSITRYFQDASSGHLTILGDYLLAPNNGGVFQVQTSDGKLYYSYGPAIESINNTLGTTFITAHGYTSISDFDQWTLPRNELQGLPKLNEGNNKWDCVIFLFRNTIKPEDGTGSTGFSMSQSLLGYTGDAYTMQCIYNEIPTRIIRHEIAHSLLGSNNFHTAGGGNVSDAYWIAQPGGWSMLGLYGSSLLTWNAWDRQRLGWNYGNNQFNPSARNQSDTQEVNGDLDATNPDDAGIYILRDFVVTGDALRIKLPFLDPETEYPQWLWIENHQGVDQNDNPFDQWQYQEVPCVQDNVPGLMMYLQIGNDVRESESAGLIYDESTNLSEYLRPLTANGFWDRDLSGQPVNSECVNWDNKHPFVRVSENPLTGGNDQEHYAYDINDDNILKKSDQLQNFTELYEGVYLKNLFSLGHTDHVFTIEGNKKVGMGTNPSSAPLMNMARNDIPIHSRPNVRKIYLNGVSVEMLEQLSDGSIKVRVRFDDVDIENDVRWCADSIVLNPIVKDGISLNLCAGKTILLDQGTTATRMNNPISYNNEMIFASPTTFTVRSEAAVNMEIGSDFVVDNGSSLILETGSSFTLNNNAELTIKSGSHLYVEDCALLSFLGNSKLIVESGATLHISPNANLFRANGSSNLQIANGAIIASGTIHPNSISSFPHHTVSSTVTVNGGNYIMPEALCIEDGGTLTITNATLNFNSARSKVQIKQGAKLIIDGGTLTSACEDQMWQGIEVWGTRSQSQYPNYNPAQP
ncbi:MAG: hypothetical protein LBM67_02040, partial [Lentimicrobiaceae bacterium]|nr:hypothetical protein [Lentimicrobiaceae bacterium]